MTKISSFTVEMSDVSPAAMWQEWKRTEMTKNKSHKSGNDPRLLVARQSDDKEIVGSKRS